MNKTKLLVDTSNKEFMLNLGILFAQGKQIEIINKDAVDEKIEVEKKNGYAKSFNMLIKYWQDNGLDYKFAEIVPNPKKVFLICPVRNATKEEKDLLNEIIDKYEGMGYDVHYPQRDTNQNPIVNGENTGGFSICCQNALAIANAETIVMFYNKDSIGSMFDLGVTSYLKSIHCQKKFIIANDYCYDENNIIDNRIRELSATNFKEEL